MTFVATFVTASVALAFFFLFFSLGEEGSKGRVTPRRLDATHSGLLCPVLWLSGVCAIHLASHTYICALFGSNCVLFHCHSIYVTATASLGNISCLSPCCCFVALLLLYFIVYYSFIIIATEKLSLCVPPHAGAIISAGVAAN